VTSSSFSRRRGLAQAGWTRLLAACVASVAALRLGCTEKQPSVGPEPAATQAQAAANVELPTRETPPGQDAGPPVNEFALAFEKEGRQNPWASGQEAALRSATSKIPDATLRAIECKTTVCRLEFSHTSAMTVLTIGQRLTVAVSMDDGSPLKSFGSKVEADAVKRTTVAWLTRDGYAQPRADGTPVPTQ
jgi:hypothetical protein